jgi:hypothetical protein
VHLGDELVLETSIRDFTGRLVLTEMMPVAPADHGGGLVAYG